MQNVADLGSKVYGIPRKLLKSIMKDVPFVTINRNMFNYGPDIDDIIYHWQFEGAMPCIFLSQNAFLSIEKRKGRFRKYIRESNKNDTSIEYIYFYYYYKDRDDNNVLVERLFVVRREDENIYRLLGIQMNDYNDGYWLNDSVRYNAIDFLYEHQINFNIPSHKGEKFDFSRIVYIDE